MPKPLLCPPNSHIPSYLWLLTTLSEAGNTGIALRHGESSNSSFCTDTERQKPFTVLEFCLSSPGHKELQDELCFLSMETIHKCQRKHLLAALSVSKITGNDTVSRLSRKTAVNNRQRALDLITQTHHNLKEKSKLPSEGV